MHLIEGQVDDDIWDECETTNNFKQYLKDKNLVKCMEILQKVCGLNANTGLKFGPSQALGMIGSAINIQQGTRPVGVFTKTVEAKVRSIESIHGPHWAGSSYLMYFLKEDGKTLDDYYKMNEND